MIHDLKKDLIHALHNSLKGIAELLPQTGKPQEPLGPQHESLLPTEEFSDPPLQGNSPLKYPLKPLDTASSLPQGMTLNQKSGRPKLKENHGTSPFLAMYH